MKDVENINSFIGEIDYEKLILAGESLGTSLASYHSSIVSEDKLVLISPFFSTLDIARKHYWSYPVRLMLRENYNSGEWVDDVSQAIIIHGAEDKIIPISQGKKLFQKINTDNKEFIEIKGAGHNDLYYFPETFKAISNFLGNL
ncbi:alpha/beta hydrolase [Patescibacteria group bacterium]